VEPAVDVAYRVGVDVLAHVGGAVEGQLPAGALHLVRAVVLAVAAYQKLGVGVEGHVFHGNPLGGVVAEVEHLVVDAVDHRHWDLL
jgi:hypothetical protein